MMASLYITLLWPTIWLCNGRWWSIKAWHWTAIAISNAGYSLILFGGVSISTGDSPLIWNLLFDLPFGAWKWTPTPYASCMDSPTSLRQNVVLAVDLPTAASGIKLNVWSRFPGYSVEIPIMICCIQPVVKPSFSNKYNNQFFELLIWTSASLCTA